MSKVTLDREVITPKQAREYLEANVHNRNLRETWVARLQGAIERGEWRETGDPIKFNGSGTLEDGQHRLEAIARAGKRVVVWVARGVSSDAQEVIDIGAKRSVGDMLKLRGYSNANLLAAISNCVWTYRMTGEVLSRHGIGPSPQQQIQLIEQEPVLIERCTSAMAFTRADRSLGIPQSLVGTFLHIFAEKTTEEDSSAFFEELLNPKAQSDPTAILRRRLLQEGPHMSIPLRLKTALIIKAWNAWVLGERPKRLTWRAGGAAQEEFPMVRGHMS